MSHPLNVPKYDGTNTELARDITNMRYDAMAALFSDIASYLAGDSEADFDRGNPQLSEGLELTAASQFITSDIAKNNVWKVCRPYMKD